MKNYNIYKDTLHGIEVAGGSKTTAWFLIRNECIYNRIQIPTYDQIEMIRELTNEEMIVIRKRQNQDSPR